MSEYIALTPTTARIVRTGSCMHFTTSEDKIQKINFQFLKVITHNVITKLSQNHVTPLI